jgi:hypothetical protein
VASAWTVLGLRAGYYIAKHVKPHTSLTHRMTATISCVTPSQALEVERLNAAKECVHQSLKTNRDCSRTKSRNHAKRSSVSDLQCRNRRDDND